MKKRRSKMKINKVEMIPVTVPLEQPIGHAFGSRKDGLFVIIKIGTDEGFEGIGGGSVLYPGYIMDGQESVMAKIKALAKDVLLGADPMKIEQILAKCDVMLRENSITKAHVDYALYDLKGKILNVPVYELLGGIGRDKIPLEWIVTLDTPEKQAENSLKYLAAGFHSLKLKVGPEINMAVKRFRTVREAVGDNIEMGIDMDGVFNSPDALRIIKRLEEYNLHFAEQPVSKHDIGGYLDIKRKTAVPLIADESAWSITETYALIKAGAADMFHLALDRIGGFRKALQFRAMVDAAHLDYAISTYNSPGISHAAATHFAISCTKRNEILDQLGNVLMYTGGVDTSSIVRPDITKEINAKIEKGYALPPKGPGLGIELNEDLIKKYITPGMSPLVIK
jgi:L-alanine-DL-glutamate epimerase-like enolase superfamily enzyme